MNQSRIPRLRISGRSALGRFAGLVLVTLFAVAVMIAFAGGNRGKPTPKGDSEASSLDLLKAPAPVFVQELEEKRLDVIHTYSGMIRPKDRYSIGFEVAGRVNWIKHPESGITEEPIDIGYRVKKDEVLARLDENILQARKREVSARLTLARDNLQRAIDSRRRVESSVTLAEVQRLRSEVDVALAQLDVAEQQLADVSLLSPVDGVIARRMVEEGETVNAHQVLFEIVSIDEVLLAVGVPESRLPEITRRRREVEANQREYQRAQGLGQSTDLEQADLEFVARVRQLGENRFGRPWPQREGRIYRIAETADDRTGLFEVEVLLDNRDMLLRPGIIALADIVIDRIKGYSLPVESIQFRERKAFLYTASHEDGDVDSGDESHLVAHKHQLNTYIEQQDTVIIPSQLEEPATDPPLPQGRTLAVVKGQHRLVDGRRVELVQEEGEQPTSLPSSATTTATTAAVNGTE